MKILAPTNRRGINCARSLFLCACVLLTATVMLRAQSTAVRVETFSLKPNGEVAVENPRGATRVESWDSQTVRVVAEKKGPAGSSIEPGELVLMGAQNSIIVQCKQGAGRIDITLYVPHTAQLQVTGGVWPVDISGTLSTAVIDTTSGNIAYRLPPNDDARVTIRSALGTVRSTIPLTAVERIGTRSLKGQIGTGAAQVILNSQNGNVTLTPAPHSAAVARVSKTDTLSARTQPSRGVTPGESESDSQKSAAQRPGGRTTIKPDPALQDDSGVSDPGATNRAAQSNGSVVFAGSDRSDDSSTTTTSGPFTRPRLERKTSGGNSGLKVRIIPSNGQPRTSRDAAGSVFDQANDEEDAQASRSSTTGSSSGSQSSNAVGRNYPASGSVEIGGTDRADVGTSKARVGPLERDRQTRNTSGGNSGMRVRIIPADSPPGPARDASSVFDQRDDGPEATASGGTATRSSSRTGSGQSARSDDYVPTGARRADSTARTDDEIASTKSRAGVPPVLQRSRAEDSSNEPLTNETGATAKSPDEDAIVLKAALVNLNVSVTNRAGVALANLKAEDFEVAENSQPQKIEFFQATTAPFNLVLVLDLSGSIKDKLDVVKSAALRFVEVLGPHDRIAVVTFTDEIRVVSQLTNDRDELKRRIKAVDRSQGGTAFYEALWFSLLDTLGGTRGQRNAIVVMTDGVDSSLDRYNPMESRVSFNQLARRLEESDVIVFPIYLDTEYEEVFERGNSSSEAYAIARDQLERIGELTGGQIFKAEKVGDLSGVYKQVAAAIRTVYSVGYYPTNADRDGTFRRVRVGVNRADAAVRTRKGYYAK
ncbi:MAG: VWA domain-containing protein [Acidobacteriota bacterium]